MRIAKLAMTILVGVLLTVFWSMGTAQAAKSPIAGGVIHACLKTKGKPAVRGTLRVVKSARACKKKGEKAIAWNVAGSAGAPGAAGGNGGPGSTGPGGPAGAPGAAGKDGATGATGNSGSTGLDGLNGLVGPTGAAGQVSQQLLDTIQSQTLKIEALEDEVTDLTGELLDLEGTVGNVQSTVGTVQTTLGTVQTTLGTVQATAGKACQQANSVTTQGNSLIGAVGSLSLEGVLGGLLKIPALPAVLPTVPC